MATQLLSDPHGQHIPHMVHHDLESFFWTTLFGLVNLRGPFQDGRDWSHAEPETIRSAEGLLETTFVPPGWMRPGLTEYSFSDVYQHRLLTLGRWEYYRSFIQPYWTDEGILSGMEKMFNIFMSPKMVVKSKDGCVVTDPTFGQDIRHADLIDIVKGIILGLQGKNDIVDMVIKGLPVDTLIEKGRQRYEAALQYNRLPPVVDNNLKNKPIVPNEPRRRPANLPPSQMVSIVPPILQEGESCYSVIGNSMAVYSTSHRNHAAMQGLSQRTFETMTGSKISKANLRAPASAPPTQFFYSVFPAALCHPLPQTISPHPARQMIATGMIEQEMDEDTTHAPSPSPSKRSADDSSSGSEGTSTKKRRIGNAGSDVPGARLGMGESDGHSGPSAGIPGGSGSSKKSGRGGAKNTRALLGKEESGGHQDGPSAGEPSSGPSTRRRGRQRGGPGPGSGPSTRRRGRPT
jgi:hypothetical protein